MVKMVNFMYTLPQFKKCFILYENKEGKKCETQKVMKRGVGPFILTLREHVLDKAKVFDHHPWTRLICVSKPTDGQGCPHTELLSQKSCWKVGRDRIPPFTTFGLTISSKCSANFLAIWPISPAKPPI